MYFELLRRRAGLLANANCGGENVHRGIALGALLGAHTGVHQIDRKWITGLKVSKNSSAIRRDIFP